MARTFRIGTRKSNLALKQTEMVISEIQKKVPDFQFEIVEILSQGCYERFQGNIKDLGGKGVFVKDLEQQILDEKIDFAVHSMKDIPTDEELPEGLCIPAVLERGDLRDVVICREGESFVGLKEGSIVGTSSLRRESQILMSFPHLIVKPIRGNVGTRIQKLVQQEYDAILLAKAGLDRLDLSSKITEVFEPDMMLPAVGQGVIGVECREGDQEVLDLLSHINHMDTMVCVRAEREMLKILGGNCHTSVGGYCEVTKGGSLRMIAHVAAPDGSDLVRSRQKMPYDDPENLGATVAEELLSLGAKRFISEA